MSLLNQSSSFYNPKNFPHNFKQERILTSFFFFLDSIFFEIVAADPLDHLPPLGTVLQEPLRTPLLHLLRHRSQRRQRLAGDPRLLLHNRPILRTLRIGRIQRPLLDLDEGSEAGVSGDDLHGSGAGVDGGGLDAVAEEGVVAEEAAEEEGEGRRGDGDGAGEMEGGGGGVEAAGEGVDVDDVGEGGWVGEFAEGGGGDAGPWVLVRVLLGVRTHHSKLCEI